ERSRNAPLRTVRPFERDDTMRDSIQLQLIPGGRRPAESFRRIARCAAVPPTINGAPPRSANDADIPSRDPNKALALRALAANGFGDAAIERTGAYAQPPAVQLHAAARTQRARAIGEAVAGAARAAGSTLRQLIADYRRHRDERETHRALAGLDARALRDIGLDRSEIGSIARELAGGHAT